MIVTAHQPNFAPGLGVIRKVQYADAVIWLDEVQFTHGGWSNRNRMPDGSWLTVPIERSTDMAPFNRVRISEHGSWREKATRTLRQHYGDYANWPNTHILRPYRLLIGLNLALLRGLAPDDLTEWHFQSHLDGGRAVVAISDDAEELMPISQRLAMMTAEIGGTVYLAGPSAKKYKNGGLDERPFHALGITVDYWTHTGSNVCSLDPRALAAA